LGAPIGNSAYNSFQLNFQKRFGHGLSFLGAYTASKMIDSDDWFGEGAIGTGYIQHPYMNHENARLLDPLDRPWKLALSWTYDLPIGTGRHFVSTAKGPLNALVGGWRLSAMQNYFAGIPDTVTTDASIPFASVWPIALPGISPGTSGCGGYIPGKSGTLNDSAFATPAAFTFGNEYIVPNLRNCTYKEEDFGLDKQFRISDRWRGSLGTMWQDAFNRHVFRTLTNDINVPSSFGQYQTTYPPRSVQLYVRLDF
jgi:hypothetical protein